MANTISFVPTVSEDHTESILTDATTYTSPTRGSVGVFLSIVKVNFRGEESPLTSISNTSTADTDSIWTFDIDQDGHHRFKYAAIPDYSGGTSYSIYQAAYDSVTNLAYRSKSNSNSGNALVDTSFWEPLTDPGALADNVGKANASTNVDAYTGNYIIYVNTEDKRDRESINASLEQDIDAERNKSVDKFRLLDIFTEGLVYANEDGEFNKAERIARRADSL